MSRAIRRPIAAALLLALVLNAAPVRAQTDLEGEPEALRLNHDHWEQIMDYAACGAALAFATGGVGVVAVVIACGRLINMYWS